jgi:hypothetical protein
MRSNRKILLSLVVAVSFLYFGVSYLIVGQERLSILKSFLTQSQKNSLLTYAFPYYKISQLEKKITVLEDRISILQEQRYAVAIDAKASNKPVEVLSDVVKLSDGETLTLYRLVNGFYNGIKNYYPGSGFLDFHQNNLVLVSARGLLAYSGIREGDFYLRQIKNNINDFIGIKQFKKNRWFSIKDLSVMEDKIFLSYTKEIRENCWNIAVLQGVMSYERIIFEDMFSPKDCIPSADGGHFEGRESGGRIARLDEEHIILSVGEFGRGHLSQDESGVNGKLITVSIKDGSHEVLSLGHRNPQGLYFDADNNFFLETEHGPQGGDEINLVDMSGVDNTVRPNYGWPIASYGEHYGGRVDLNRDNYAKEPLYKSHAQYGYVEPIKYFVPSIGISQIARVAENKYVVGSMRDQSLYFFGVNKEGKIRDLRRVHVGERIRDLVTKSNKLYLFLEDSASIGVISLAGD